MKGQSSTFKKKTIIEIIAVAILVVIAIASIVIFLKDRISSEAIDKDNQTEQIDNNQKADDNSNQNNGQEPDGTNQENNQNSGNNANNNNEDNNNNSNNSNGNNTNNTNNNTGVTTGSNVNEIGETTVERVEEREKLVSRDYWDWWKPTTISVNSTVANIVPALPDITVTKTAETDAGNKLVYAGEKITYTIVVKNNGNQDVEKIEVMDKIPSNTTFDSVENEGIVVKSSKAPEKVVGIKWIITVKAGEEVSLKFTVVVDSGVTGTITNKAIANGEESNEENTSIITSNKTSEILRYNKETNKFETVNVAKIDDEITYTISVTNTGDENGTTKIVDTVPEGTVLKRGSAEGAEISKNHKTVTWNDVEVPAGETVERTFTVIVKDIKSLENKKITNIATVGEKETNETENSTAEINVEKTVIDILRNDESIGLDAEVKEGDVIKYKITVTNTGSEDLTNVIVDEKLEGIELNEKELNIGNLKAGENKEIFASYTVSYEKDIKENVGKLVHNEVKVTGETIPTDPDKEPEKVEDKDEIDTLVADAPSVDINKVATRVKENGSEEFVPVTEKTKVRPGDVIEYVITVTNTGNVTLENIKVTDSLKVTVNGEVKDVDENGTSIIAEIKKLSAEAGKNVETITTYYTVVDSDVVEEKTIMNTATVIIPDVPGKDSTEEVPVNPDTSVSGTKIWKDNNNEYKARPTSIVINLLQNGEQIDSKKVEATEDWIYTFDKLPKYDVDGKEYTYTITENEVAGYVTEISENDVINTVTGITEVSGTKTWKDNNNEYKTRPTSIVINLLQNGEKFDSKKVVATDDWAYEFKNLPEYDKDGVKYNYTVTEEEVTGYVTEISGYDVINTLTGTTSVNAIKIWQDNNNTYGTRPESITINLLQNGKQIDSKEIGESSDWAYEFKNLPEYDENGVKYNYSLTEENVAGYVTEISGYDVINTLTGKTDVSGTKTWVDGGKTHNNEKEIILVLTRKSEKVESVEETVEAKVVWNGNTYTFSDLDKYDAEGYLYIYKVTENKVNDYTTEQDENNFTNTMSEINDKIEISGTKTWVDGGKLHDNAKEIILVLTRASAKSGSVEEKVEATPTWNGNTYTFSNLSKYDAKGYLYTYKVSETEIKGYDTTTSGNNFTNTMSEINDKIEISGTKTWVDGGKAHNNATEITLVLTRTSTKTGSVAETVEAIPTWDGNTYTFSNLSKYDTEGYLYEYKVSENAIYEYTTNVDGRNFINIMSNINDKIDVTGTKTWVDGGKTHINSDEISLTLTRISAKAGSVEETVEVTPAWNGNIYTFSNLSKYDAEGYLYTYKVSEVQIKGYDTTTSGNNFTNTMSNISETINVTGTKTWVDGGKLHDNAKEIILALTRTSTKPGSVEETVVATPTWDGNTYTFSNLAKYDTEGYLYTYKVVEDAIDGYTTVQDGRNFINTISDINEKINVIGTKTWIDGGREHDNTTEITLVLTRTSTKPGSVEEIVEVTPTWNGSTYTFSYLAKYDAEGYLYEYKVAENPVDRYITKVNGYNFTNTMSEINDTIDISGTKIWEDNENAYGTRPTSITVNLLQNGTKVASKRVTSADNWRYSFTDMPKYDAEGYPYTYTVTENAVSNYDTSVNGYNITNRLKLSLNKKATDKNGNIITELIYDSKSEASRKFNYVLTVTGQGQQTVTDVLPSGIVIEDNWSADNVTVTTDTTGRQTITWNVNLTDDAADELIIPVIATEKVFEGKETESETVKSVLNLNFHNAGSTGKGNKDEYSKKVNIFLRALGNADPSTDDGYIYAGQTTIATRYINEIKYASGQAKFVSGYDDAKVNSILSTKNTAQIEKMLTDFSKDNESSTGLGKYISGGLPSVATIRQNIKTLYSDKIELTDTQIILWYKVPYSVDEEVARNYVITDKENGNKKLVDKTINLPNCGYHIDGLIVDIKDLGGYIPEGTKVSVKNVANLGKIASEATVDIIYEKKLSESKVSSQELVSDDIEVNVEENIKQSEEPISKVEEKKVVNEETTKTDITTPSNTTKNVVSNTEQVVEKKDDEKVTASKESKFTVETSED